MLRLLSCIAYEHDFRLVAVAALVCLTSALTVLSLLEQARVATRRRLAWLTAVAFVSGSGIWATHFIAMLAYQPDLPIGFDPGLTLLSVVAGIVITGAGWWLVLSRRRWSAVTGGLVVGAGIGTMHYLGMAAATLGGRIVYDKGTIAASLILGCLFSIAAAASCRADPRHLHWRAAGLFTLAICSLHFVGMGSISILPDPWTEVPAASIGSDTLAMLVTVTTLCILLMSLSLVLFDRKLTRRGEEEVQRLRAFADAAVEGLVVVDGDRVVDANRSFCALADRPVAAGERLSAFFPGLATVEPAAGTDAFPVETQLLTACGEARDVEVLTRPLDWGGKKLRVLAVRDIRERKEAAARIAHLAYHDALTGLPNRAVFGERLEQAVAAAAATDETLAVLCLDLDSFKAVNDLFGHPAADELLVQVAHRLRQQLGPKDLVARLGGDEFAILQPCGRQPHQSGRLAEALIEALKDEFLLADQSVRIGCSIGMALFPADAATGVDLVKNADMALFRAKREGRGTFRCYEPAMDQDLRERRQLASDLRHAIERDELTLEYQPLADLGSGQVVGFEALLRWHNPRLGPVRPDVFIPLAEENGFIVPLGAWVLRRACTEAARWGQPLTLAVNLSPAQFQHGDLAAEVEQILRETGLEGRRLELEITEGLLVKDTEHALGMLRRLKALGVRISMDDFGTGYSSLSYFRLFPFDKVKIDRSFVQEMAGNPQAMAVVQAVIGLGRGLSMSVVAEGVETEEQLATLRLAGCDQAQGYLISRPAPIGRFDHLLADRECRPGRPAPRVAHGGAPLKECA